MNNLPKVGNRIRLKYTVGPTGPQAITHHAGELHVITSVEIPRHYCRFYIEDGVDLYGDEFEVINE